MPASEPSGIICSSTSTASCRMRRRLVSPSCVDLLQQAADAGAVHFDGDEVGLRIRLRDRRGGLAHAGADLEHHGRGAAEKRCGNPGAARRRQCRSAATVRPARAAARAWSCPGAGRSCGSPCSSRLRLRWRDACLRWARRARRCRASSACGRRGRLRARPRPPFFIALRHQHRVLRRGDRRVHQHAVAAQLHRDGGVGGRADAGVDQHRHLDALDDELQVPRD